MRNGGRKTLVAGVLALSLVLTGIGYAYWTDSLNVTTKATTGDMDVTFVDLGLYAQYDNEMKTKGWSIVDGIGANGYVNDEFFQRGTSNYNAIAKTGSISEYYARAEGYNNVTFNALLENAAAIKRQVGPYTPENANGSKNIKLEINNMYPGYAQAFRTDIINQGSIAAKLSNLKFTVSKLDDSELTAETKALLGVALYVNRDDNNAGVIKLCEKLARNTPNNYFTVGGVHFLRLSALEGLTDAQIKSVITESNAVIQSIDPSHDGDSKRMDLFIAVAMDPDADGKYTTGTVANIKANKDDTKSQNNGAVLSIDLGWDQFNAGVDKGNGNILVEQNR